MQFFSAASLSFVPLQRSRCRLVLARLPLNKSEFLDVSRETARTKLRGYWRVPSYRLRLVRRRLQLQRPVAATQAAVLRRLAVMAAVVAVPPMPAAALPEEVAEEIQVAARRLPQRRHHHHRRRR